MVRRKNQKKMKTYLGPHVSAYSAAFFLFFHVLLHMPSMQSYSYDSPPITFTERALILISIATSSQFTCLVASPVWSNSFFLAPTPQTNSVALHYSPPSPTTPSAALCHQFCR